MKKTTRNSLLFLLFLVVIAFGAQLLGWTGVAPNFDEDALTVTGPQKFSFTVDYDSITALELVELDGYGDLISGDENRTYVWGVRENDAWGRYTLCVAKKTAEAVLITTQEGEKFVFNYQGSKTTQGISEMFVELLAHRAEDTGES